MTSTHSSYAPISDYYTDYYAGAVDLITDLQHNPDVDEVKAEMEGGELDGNPPLEETGMSLSPDGIPMGMNLPPDRKPLDDEVEITEYGTTQAPKKDDE